MKPHKNLLLLLILIAFGLRIWGLAEHNIWWDEGIGIWLSRMPAVEIVRWTAGDVHPPLYYLLLRGWRLVAGEGEFLLRFPSVLFSTLAVALIYRLGRALNGHRTGLLAALILTLSRFAVIWAQEIRMYAPAATMTTGVLWASARFWRRNDRAAWLAYVITTLGSLFTLYLAAMIPLVANVGFVVAWWRAQRPRRLLWRWISAQVVVAALFLPWLAYALPKMHGWSSDSAVTPGFFAKLYGTMLAVGSPLNLESYLPFTVAVFAVLLAGLALLVRDSPSPAQMGGLTMLLTGLLLPALIVYVISSPIFGFYYARPLVPRYLLPLSACFYTLLAWGIDALSRQPHAYRARLMTITASGIVVLAALVGLRRFYPGRARRDDYVSISQALAAHRRPSDAVVLYVDRDWPIFVAHYPGAWQPVPYGETQSVASAESHLAPIWETSEGIWLVTTPEALQSDPQQVVPDWLASRAVGHQTVVTGESELTLYAKTEERLATLLTLAPGFAPPTNVAAEIAGGKLKGVHIPLSRYRTGDTLHLSLYWSSAPTSAFSVRFAGPEIREVRLPSPETTDSYTAAVRQQVDLPLSPDLPGGRYRISIQAPGGKTVPVGDFALLQRAAGTSISPTEVEYPLNYRLGEAIHLVGYDLPRTQVEPGGVLPLTLYWRTEAPQAERYKVFTHLVGESYNAATGNFLWGQQDNEPGGGQIPTTLWAPGKIVVDRYRIPVASDAPPGRYTLQVGMYGLVDIARLPVFDNQDSSQGDAIRLTDIEVVAPQ